MSELLKINVNDHTEKKNGLTYLSWAWAWAEVLKTDPGATWVCHTYGPPGSEEPCMRIGKTAMVHVSVTIKGLRRECMLPVMDHRNKAISEPDAFQINTAIMRCMTKAISMHGLGLYIYAGEDLPEDEGAEAKKAATPKGGPARTFDTPLTGDSGSAPQIIFNNLSPDWQEWLAENGAHINNVFEQQGKDEAQRVLNALVEDNDLDATYQAALSAKMNSKTRAALTAHIKKAA